MTFRAHKNCGQLVFWRWMPACVALFLGQAGLRAASPLRPFMPRAEDFTFLWWANGPQHYLGMKQPPPEAVLCLQSGVIGLALDTKSLQLLHAGRFVKPLDRQRALRPDNAAVFWLPPARVEVSVREGNREVHCACSGALPKNAFDISR